MSVFEQVKATYGACWTTVRVGWDGLGVLSPWPERWTEFSPLLSPDEIAAYAYERMTTSSGREEERLIVELLGLDLQTESRETVGDRLRSLSELDGRESEIELRKWRVVLLEQVLRTLPHDALYGLMALSEFWQGFGFPSDSPHEVQGRGNAIDPSEYYQQDNMDRIVGRHRAWIEDERRMLRGQRGC